MYHTLQARTYQRYICYPDAIQKCTHLLLTLLPLRHTSTESLLAKLPHKRPEISLPHAQSFASQLTQYTHVKNSS